MTIVYEKKKKINISELLQLFCVFCVRRRCLCRSRVQPSQRVTCKWFKYINRSPYFQRSVVDVPSLLRYIPHTTTTQIVSKTRKRKTYYFRDASIFFAFLFFVLRANLILVVISKTLLYLLTGLVYFCKWFFFGGNSTVGSNIVSYIRDN